MLINVLMLIFWPDHADELRAQAGRVARPATTPSSSAGTLASTGTQSSTALASTGSVHRGLQDSLNVSRAPSPGAGSGPEPEPEPEPESRRTAEWDSEAHRSIQGASQQFARHDGEAANDADAEGGELELKDNFTEKFLQEKIGIQTAHAII